MKIVTIDREYGAGGHTVGWEVAKRLGVEFYDRDIIRTAAKTIGIEPDEVESEEESMSLGDSIVSAIIPISYELKDMIFEKESQAVIDLASNGPCVVLGRCSNAILTQKDIEHVSIFLHADKEHRMPNVGRIIGIEDADEILHRMKKKDTQRKTHYEHFTNLHWGDYHDYDLCLDTGALGYDLCAEIIAKAAQ